MGDLTKLIARLEALESPSPMVDLAIWEALNKDRALEEEPCLAYDFCYSLEAAVALTERVLPGWAFRLESGTPTAQLWECDDRGWHKSGMDQHVGTGPTPAIALILATLKALAAKETKNG